MDLKNRFLDDLSDQNEQARELISYSRGKIRVLDRPAIERCACECYAAIQPGVAMIVD